MITTKIENNTINVAVLGEFTLADYKEFEEAVLRSIQSKGPLNILFDLRDMIGFTIDVAWEEIKFSREHPFDFSKIAIVTGDQWVAWSAWISRLFTDANTQVFDDYDVAHNWATLE